METMIKAVRSAGLFARNWSLSPGATVLAIYEEGGEGFIGTVSLVGDAWQPQDKGTAREKRELSKLCATANKAVS